MADRPSGESGANRSWEEVFAHAPWGIRLGSANGRTVEAVNPEFARMHGYSADEMRQMPVEALYPPDLRASVAEHWERARDGGHYNFESWHLRRDGSRFPVLVQFTANKDAAGEVVSQAVNVLDLTERYRA
ncbi:MAG TPA: PAS domain S-box protein, partial [Gemmatimonadales bacterium]|nr:PAS domain S-box protein [Gemmatimonadales bacterium]